MLMTARLDCFTQDSIGSLEAGKKFDCLQVRRQQSSTR